MVNDLASVQETWLEKEPAKRATFVAWSLSDCLEDQKCAFATTRGMRLRKEMIPDGVSTLKAGGGEDSVIIQENLQPSKVDLPTEEEELDSLQVTEEYWGALNPPPNIHIEMDRDFREAFVADYQQDVVLKRIWNDKSTNEEHWKPGQRYFKNEDGLLFFRDADYQPRLCVPEKQRKHIMEEAHENPFETAHVSPERLWRKLSSRFYWDRMKKDLSIFCDSCDICQKIKHRNFTKYGYLIPNPIPSRPYESISLDLIVNLPWSGEYNAILVVVDRLSKHASFIPTTSGLNAEGFAELFVKYVASRFGLPDSIIADRDPRWASDFWKAVAKILKTRMALSSSHHPQHDGQTENVNRQLETMLRAYVSRDRNDWADWLQLLEFAYNSNVHASIGTSPFSILYGFEPKTPLEFILPRKERTHLYGMSSESSQFLEELSMHRESARLAIAKAQESQAKFYNRGRKDVPEFGIGSKVLISPHSLEWIESKGEGAKLVQRWIGPFEVLQKLNPRTY
jgi:hypothetical protein